MDHLGVEVEETEQVTAATQRLKDAGLATFEENDTSCCYALQDKVWVHGPGQEPWEVYTVKADADVLEKAEDSARCASGAADETDGEKVAVSANPHPAAAADIDVAGGGVIHGPSLPSSCAGAARLSPDDRGQRPARKRCSGSVARGRARGGRRVGPRRRGRRDAAAARVEWKC